MSSSAAGRTRSRRGFHARLSRRDKALRGPISSLAAPAGSSTSAISQYRRITAGSQQAQRKGEGLRRVKIGDGKPLLLQDGLQAGVERAAAQRRNGQLTHRALKR